VFAEEGVAFEWDDYRRLANGRPRDHVIRAVLGDVAPDRLEDLMARKESAIFEILRDRGLQPIPGSLEMAHALRARGLRTAIASSSRTARRFLEALRPPDPALGRPAELFDAVLEGDSRHAPKPDPGIFLAAAEAVGVKPSRCVAFEDAPNGVRAARGAGMWVVALTTTVERGALGESHVIFSSFAEIDPDALCAGRIESKPVDSH
jgi:HAD superfamily hydrolase (TIGR01509 family)